MDTGRCLTLSEVQETVSNKLPGLRSLLVRPISVKNLLFTGYASCLFILTFVRLPRSSLEPVFLAGMCLGVGSVSALVFSPGSKQAGSKSAAFSFALLMHGLLAAISIINNNYYPRMLAGDNFGEAIPYSAWVVLLEWGAVLMLGRLFASDRRLTVPLWLVACALLFLAVVVAAPKMQGRGYQVVAGQPPVRYYRFSEPVESDESAEYPVAVLDGVFVLLRTGWDRTALKEFSVLRGFDTKNDKQWTMDVVPSTYMLPRAHLALGEAGELLVVQGTVHSNETGDMAVWVTEVDVHSATKGKPELVVRAPWLDPDASAALLSPEWRRPPFSRQSGVNIDVDEEGVLSIRGSGFQWNLAGDPRSVSFIVGEDVVVIRELIEETYTYHILLLPSRP